MGSKHKPGGRRSQKGEGKAEAVAYRGKEGRKQKAEAPQKDGGHQHGKGGKRVGWGTGAECAKGGRRVAG